MKKTKGRIKDFSKIIGLYGFFDMGSGFFVVDYGLRLFREIHEDKKSVFRVGAILDDDIVLYSPGSLQSSTFPKNRVRLLKPYDKKTNTKKAKGKKEKKAKPIKDSKR